MEQKALIYGEKCLNKNTFHKNKKPINIDKVETKRTMFFCKSSYGNKGLFKHGIEYRNETDPFPAPLCVKHPQMKGYVNNNKCINYLVCDGELLKNTIKYGIKLKIYLKESLIVNQCITYIH